MTNTAALPDCKEAAPGSTDELCACLERFYELLTARREPTLYRAELYTLTGAMFAKHEEVGVYVEVKTADDRTLLAYTTNADTGYGFYYYLNSVHVVPLVTASTGIAKADCLGFKVRLWISFSAEALPGLNPWQLDLARIMLAFTDGTVLVAENRDFQLLGDEATALFAAP
jgi:hypothetical protein